jgi:hypothetical protein
MLTNLLQAASSLVVLALFVVLVITFGRNTIGLSRGHRGGREDDVAAVWVVSFKGDWRHQEDLWVRALSAEDALAEAARRNPAKVPRDRVRRAPSPAAILGKYQLPLARKRSIVDVERSPQ